MARSCITLSLALVGGAAAMARAPAPRCCAAQPQPPASTKQLYAQIESALRRARKKDSDDLGARTARSLGNRWMELDPEVLVEATLISGRAVLRDFDEGFAILSEAEENAALNVSARAYSALMGLAQAEERPVEALSLLARTRAFEVERTDGLLLSAMRAAAALEDWGAVGRLYAELTSGPEAAAIAALELESYGDAAMLDELRAELGLDAGAVIDAQAELAQAQHLALRAHCERGDVTRVVELLGRMRLRGAALEADEYARLARLARASRRATPLLALEPVDLRRSLAAAVEPSLFAVTSQLNLAASYLGRIERLIAAGILAAVLVGAAAAILAAGGAPDGNTAADAAGALDVLADFDEPALRGLYR